MKTNARVLGVAWFFFAMALGQASTGPDACPAGLLNDWMPGHIHPVTTAFFSQFMLGKTPFADPGFQQLTQSQKRFLGTVLLPTVGLRALRSPTAFRDWAIENTGNGMRITIGGFSGLKLLDLEWPVSSALAAPEIESQRNRRVLRIPPSAPLEFADDEALQAYWQPILLRWLMGHSLHPYLDHPAIQHERKQLRELPPPPRAIVTRAVRAAERRIVREEKSFLYVAPTHCGKHEVLLETLFRATERFTDRKLHFVISRFNARADEMAEKLRGDSRATKINVSRPNASDPDVLREILFNTRISTLPVVVSITGGELREILNVAFGNDLLAKQVHQRMQEESLDPDEMKAIEVPEALKRLHAVLGSVGVDEAMQLGSQGFGGVARLLNLGDPDGPFLYGTSVAPVREDVPVFERYFAGAEHLAFLDTEAGAAIRRSSGRFEGNIPIRQTSLAIEGGHLAALEHLYFLDPKKMMPLNSQTNFFMLEKPTRRTDGGTDGPGGERWVVNPDPEVYRNVFLPLAPLFVKHSRGFVIANSIPEANRVAEHLNALFKEKPWAKARFAAFHSDLGDRERALVLQDFESGRVQFLIGVSLFDAGPKYESMSLAVDLRRRPNARRFLERLSHLLHPSAGKEEVDVVSFVDLYDQVLADQLDLMLAARDGSLRSKVSRREGQRETIPMVGVPVTYQQLFSDEATYLAHLDNLIRDYRRQFFTRPNQVTRFEAASSSLQQITEHAENVLGNLRRAKLTDDAAAVQFEGMQTVLISLERYGEVLLERLSTDANATLFRHGLYQDIREAYFANLVPIMRSASPSFAARDLEKKVDRLRNPSQSEIADSALLTALYVSDHGRLPAANTIAGFKLRLALNHREAFLAKCDAGIRELILRDRVQSLADGMRELVISLVDSLPNPLRELNRSQRTALARIRSSDSAVSLLERTLANRRRPDSLLDAYLVATPEEQIADGIDRLVRQHKHLPAFGTFGVTQHRRIEWNEVGQHLQNARARRLFAEWLGGLK